MNKEAFLEFPILKTNRLILRQFTLEDYNDYIKWHRNDITYYMQGLHNIQEGDIEAYKRLFLKNAPRMFLTKESTIWCIALKKSDQCIGKIELCKFDSYCNTGHLTYCLSFNERRKGYISEAVNAVLDWAFNIVLLNRVSANVWEGNLGSCKVLEKIGFKLEGILRQSTANRYTIDGIEIKDTLKDKSLLDQKKYIDERIYGCLKFDFNQKKDS